MLASLVRLSSSSLVVLVSHLAEMEITERIFTLTDGLEQVQLRGALLSFHDSNFQPLRVSSFDGGKIIFFQGKRKTPRLPRRKKDSPWQWQSLAKA